MSTQFARPEPEMTRVAATIGKSVAITGQIASREDLFIDGEVEGTIELPEHKLTVGQHGKVKASIRAREVVIAGFVQGNVEAADRVDIRKEARLVGDIRTSRIVIEDGAVFKGSIDIVKPEPKPVVKATPAAPAAAAPAPAPAQALLTEKR
jgi:cytoskeletal protein CcmA (bactofilin family)